MQITRLNKLNIKHKTIFDGTLDLLYKQIFNYEIDNEKITVLFSDFENNYLSTFSLFCKSLLLNNFFIDNENKESLYYEIVNKLNLKSKIHEYNNPTGLKYYYVKSFDFSPCFTIKSLNEKYLLFCFGVSELNPGRYVILYQGILELTK